MSFRALCKLSVGVVALLAASSAFGANIVLNPGFETGDFSFWVGNGNWNVIGAGGTAGVFPNSGSFFANSGCVGTTCIAPDSDSSGAAAWLYQDLATVNGDTYTLSFAYASGNSASIGSLGSLAFTGVELQVLWGDSAIPLVASAPGTCTGGTNCIFDTTDTTNGTNYVVYTISGLQATSTSTRLEFLGEQDPAELGLDDVSVDASAVPEPSGFLLLGSGLLGMGALARRKLRG